MEKIPDLLNVILNVTWRAQIHAHIVFLFLKGTRENLRWICVIFVKLGRLQGRRLSIESVQISFEAIVTVLQKVTNNEMNCDIKTCDQAKSRLKNMKTFDFIFSLATLRFILRPYKVLMVQLQEAGLNLLDALTLVRTTTTALEKNRNAADVDNPVMAAAAMARQFGCLPRQEFNRHHRSIYTTKDYIEM